MAVHETSVSPFGNDIFPSVFRRNGMIRQQARHGQGVEEDVQCYVGVFCLSLEGVEDGPLGIQMHVPCPL